MAPAPAPTSLEMDEIDAYSSLFLDWAKKNASVVLRYSFLICYTFGQLSQVQRAGSHSRCKTGFNA